MTVWGLSALAVSGSSTISRIFPRTNSAAVSLATGSNSRSLNDPMNVRPPTRQRCSKISRRSSSSTSKAPTSSASSRMWPPNPVVVARAAALQSG